MSTLKISQMNKGNALSGEEMLEMAQQGKADSVHVTPDMINDFIRKKHMEIKEVVSSRILLPSDIGCLLVATGNNDIALTVNTGLPTGFWCRLKNKTNGQKFEIVAGTAAISNPEGLFGIGLGGRAELQPTINADEFDLYGDLEPSVTVTNGLLLLLHGQSNATRRAPKVTANYPPNLKTFTGFGQASDRTDGSSITSPIPNTGFESTALFSEFGEDAEGLAAGFANVSSESYQEIITATPAIGARHYRELMKGTGAYSNLIRSFDYGKKFLLQSADQMETLIIWDHGESDADTSPPGGGGTETTITKQQYLDILSDLVSAFTKDYTFSLNTPSPNNLIIMGVQICVTAGEGWRNVQNAHLEKAIENNGYYLAGPRYAYEYESDGTHITGYGKRLFSEYLAHRYQQVMTGNHLPVYIMSATRSGVYITLTYHTIEGNVVIDQAAVPETTTSFPNSKLGFECFVAGSSVGITSVSAAGNIVTIRLDTDPGAQVEVRYAQMTWPGGSQSVTGSASKLARGNIRDSGEYAALHDASKLHNWACHQTILTDI